MVNTNIYKPFNTIAYDLPTSTIGINKLVIANSIPDLLESTVYMRDILTLYQLALSPKQTNIVIQDIIKNFDESDLLNELSDYMEADRSRYMTTQSNIYHKSYTLQGAYAHQQFVSDMATTVPFSRITENRFYCYNADLITDELFEFIIEITRPNNSYMAVMLKVPTFASRAMTEYVYILSTLFKTLRVTKHKSSFWFTDSFIITAQGPLTHNINNFKNLIGTQLASEVELKKRIITLTKDKLSGKRFTHLLVDQIPLDFIQQWNKFRNQVRDEIYRYHKLVKMSVDSNNTINDYQIFLRSMNSGVNVVAGKYRDRENFSQYMKRIHHNNESIMRIVYSFTQLEEEADFTEDRIMDEFKHRGQVKLYLTEMRYIERIYKYIESNRPQLIIYIGAAPGIHIIPLIQKVHRPNVSWVLYDKAKFVPALLDPVNQGKYNITVIQDFFTLMTVEELTSTTSIYRDHEKHVISDIRSVVGEEVTTSDLVRDYAIEDNLVMKLKPATAFLKWRYPYLTEAEQDFMLSRVWSNRSEEWLQAYAKTKSSELRLYLEGPEYFIKHFDYQSITKAERLMAAYKIKHRFNPRDLHKDMMLVTSCRCNDCCMLNTLIYDLSKHNIRLTVDDVTKACGA